MSTIVKTSFAFCLFAVSILICAQVFQASSFAKQYLENTILTPSFQAQDTSVRAPKSQELFLSINNRNETAKLQHYISSGPLIPTAFLPNQSAALDNRWICIQRIRKRQWDSLSPFFSHLHLSDEIATTDHQSLLLIDPAYHSNFGDTLLTYGEYAFFQRISARATASTSSKNDRLDGTGQKNEMVIDECNYGQSGKPSVSKIIWCDKFFERARASLFNESVNADDKPTRLAVWHAGGNWGDLYPNIQEHRMRSFKLALEANYSILSMPQSMYYQKATTKHKEAEKIQQKIREGIENITQTFASPARIESTEDLAKARCVLTWREQESFERATRLYPFVTNLLVPDIAFQVGPYWGDPYYNLPKKNKKKQDTVDILFLLRIDSESLYKEERIGGEVMDRLLANHTNGRSKRLTHSIVDWRSRQNLFQDRDLLSTQTAVQMLKLGRVVICDRLHAAILSYLAGVPFVFLDQVSNKVTNVLSVAFMPHETGTKDDDHDCLDGREHMWAKATSMDDAVSKAVQFLDDYGL